MHDMLVRLYALPSLDEAIVSARGRGFSVSRPIAPRKRDVLDFVAAHFPRCGAEVETAFARVPATCFIAEDASGIAGFACHDVTARNFFGPEGVAPRARGMGVGRALLLAALHAQRAQGYAYAIIGGVGPAAFYAKAAGAVAIEGSTPGIYGA